MYPKKGQEWVIFNAVCTVLSTLPDGVYVDFTGHQEKIPWPRWQEHAVPLADYQAPHDPSSPRGAGWLEAIPRAFLLVALVSAAVGMASLLLEVLG